MPCGVGDYTSRLCEHLSALSIRVHVLTSRCARPDFRLGGQALLEVHALLDSWSFKMLKIVKQTVEQLKPDIILFEWPTAAYGRSLAVNWLPGFLKRRFPHIPRITTLHEFRYFHWLSRLRVWPALLYSNCLIVVDPQDISEIKNMYPSAIQRYRMIPIGSNLPAVPAHFDRQQRRRQLGLDSDDFVIAFFGFANPPKGLETLFSAICRLRKDHPCVKLLLLPRLSQKQSYQRKLLNDLIDMGLDPFTVQPDYAQPQAAAEILACADCAALPFVDGVSLKRGSLFACLEQGLPVVTTSPQRSGVFPFVEGKHLLMVPPEDEIALADALAELIRDRTLRQRLCTHVKDKLSQFSWETIAEQHCELFAEVQEEIF